MNSTTCSVVVKHAMNLCHDVQAFFFTKCPTFAFFQEICYLQQALVSRHKSGVVQLWDDKLRRLSTLYLSILWQVDCLEYISRVRLEGKIYKSFLVYRIKCYSFFFKSDWKSRQHDSYIFRDVNL